MTKIFTNKDGDTIIERLQAYTKSRAGLTNSYSHVGFTVMGGTDHPEICYRPSADRLHVGRYDFFGLHYGGWTKDKPMVHGYGPEALLWLGALLNPEGPFKGVLPYLYHTDPAEVLEDKGFVFKGLTPIMVDKKITPTLDRGLLWCFAQATRLMFENTKRMERFQYASTVTHPNTALLVTLSLMPVNGLTGNWTMVIPAHGEPLSSEGYKRAHRFLNCDPVPTTTIGPGGSANCFGNVFIDYRSQHPRQSLPEWITRFENERTNPRDYSKQSTAQAA